MGCSSNTEPTRAFLFCSTFERTGKGWLSSTCLEPLAWVRVRVRVSIRVRVRAKVRVRVRAAVRIRVRAKVGVRV